MSRVPRPLWRLVPQEFVSFPNMCDSGLFSACFSGVVYSWNSALVDRVGSMDSRFLAVFIMGENMVPITTNAQIVSWLSWCADTLLSGVFPHNDHEGKAWAPGTWRQSVAGTAIAAGLGGAFSAVTHDAKARFITHQFTNYYSCNNVCESCAASARIASLSFADSRSSAHWRRWQFTHAQYVEHAAVLSPWLQMSGFELSRAIFDFMHCMHVGVARDFCAQTLYDMARLGYAGGGSLADQLLVLWADFCKFCRRIKMQFCKRRFAPKVLGLRKSGNDLVYPEMNSRTKAAHVVPIIHYLAWKTRDVLSRRDPITDPLGEVRAWCAFGIADLLHVMSDSSVLLSDDSVVRAQTSGRLFLLSWQTMAADAISSGLCCYKIRPKHHYIAHILDRLVSRENVRVLSNFLQEDFIGKIVKLAKRQHSKTVVRRTVQLYIMALQHRWHIKTLHQIEASTVGRRDRS